LLPFGVRAAKARRASPKRSNFFLTGQIDRRALVASGQDEFANALRNAHLPAGTPCFVQATIIDGKGASHTIKRTLKTDYGKKQDCESKLEIDGAVAAESALAGVGIVLSQPRQAVPSSPQSRQRLAHGIAPAQPFLMRVYRALPSLRQCRRSAAAARLGAGAYC